MIDVPRTIGIALTPHEAMAVMTAILVGKSSVEQALKEGVITDGQLALILSLMESVENKIEEELAALLSAIEGEAEDAEWDSQLSLDL